jgi:hypothetical protein
MIRRCLLAVAGLTLALAAGCGSMMLAAREGEPVWLLHRLNWTVYQPSHRVALATLQVLKESDLTDVKIVADELTLDNRYNTPDGKVPKPGDIKIPDEYPAFWLDGFDDHPRIVNCRFCSLEGKTKDGKMVYAVVRLEIVGKSEQHTVVSVQVGRKGDEKLTKSLIDKISSRVLEPKIIPGSPEERTALNDAFKPRPGTEDRMTIAAGELRVRKS